MECLIHSPAFNTVKMTRVAGVGLALHGVDAQGLHRGVPRERLADALAGRVVHEAQAQRLQRAGVT